MVSDSLYCLVSICRDVHVSVEVSAAEVVTAEAAACFLHCFLERHFYFYVLEVVLSFACRALYDVYAACRSRVVRLCGRSFNAAVERVVKAEVSVDVVSSDLACSDGADSS